MELGRCGSCAAMLCLLLVESYAAVASGWSLGDALHRIRPTAAEADPTEVTRMPGFRGGLPSKHYAGYITVDAPSKRSLYYHLVSSSSPASRDLVIWLTGGPGCSSMDAFTYENGPFIFSIRPGATGSTVSAADVVLSPNPHSWSAAASIVYVDSPAGTGFSFTPGQRAPYVTNDTATIDDLETFVAGLMARYPHLAGLRLYIAGESYAGVYVPLLAQRLLKARQPAAEGTASSSTTSSSGGRYNLAGYIVGNAVTDDAYDLRGQVEFAYGTGLIDPTTHDGVLHTCQANDWDVSDGSACANALSRMEAAMGNINQYDTLVPCFHHDDEAGAHDGSSKPGASASLRQLLHGPAASWPLRPAFPRSASVITNGYALAKAAAARSGLRHTISCADRRAALAYYNDPGVRAAIHAAPLEDAGRWEPCSDVLSYRHTAGSMLPVHTELLDAGLRGLVLSGDADYIVPFTGSRAWVYNLQPRRRVVKPWRPWQLQRGDGQVAGYRVSFEGGLTFATVHGAGHMVPQTQPQAALALLQQWLDDSL